MEDQALANPFRSDQKPGWMDVWRFRRRRSDYTIAWICAKPEELRASVAMLDDKHRLLRTDAGDENAYVLGHIGRHNVVMACLSHYGTHNAATVATNLTRSFPSISATLMVGIGGGIPSQADLRLGDVVVGTQVIQYDMVKVVKDGHFQVTAEVKTPASRLISAVNVLQSEHGQDQSGSQITSLVRERLPRLPRPNQPDLLFQADYEHYPLKAPTCDDCDLEKLQLRAGRLTDEPRVHYGVIASGNRVMKHGNSRDDIAQRHAALCFEMEAAGMMDTHQCLPIRGICDYSDSHKNKAWQAYAAATAAAYARELLGVLPPETGRGPSCLRGVWERPPRTRWLIAFFLALLVMAGIIGPCVGFLLKNAEPSARNKQDTILPQVLTSAKLDGQTFLLARGNDGYLSFTTREGGSWTLRWNRTEQQTQSQPASIVWGNPKRLSVFCIRDDNMVMTSTFYNGGWGDWEALGAKASSPPVLCQARDNTVHVWAREDAQSKFIRHNYWEPLWDQWHTLSSDWESSINEGVARGASSAPAVVCRNSSIPNDVLIYDKDLGFPLHRQWNSTRNRWEPWQTLNGSFLGEPVLVSPTDDRIDFFGISKRTKSLIHISWTLGLGYTSPDDLGGSWKSVPSVAITTSGRLDIFVLSERGTVNHRALIGTTWIADWSDLDISSTSAPLAIRLDTTPPQIMLLVIGTGGVVLSSEWEVTDDGGLRNAVPMTQIGDGVSADWMSVD